MRLTKEVIKAYCRDNPATKANKFFIYSLLNSTKMAPSKTNEVRKAVAKNAIKRAVAKNAVKKAIAKNAIKNAVKQAVVRRALKKAILKKVIENTSSKS